MLQIQNIEKHLVIFLLEKLIMLNPINLAITRVNVHWKINAHAKKIRLPAQNIVVVQQRIVVSDFRVVGVNPEIAKANYVNAFMPVANVILIYVVNAIVVSFTLNM